MASTAVVARGITIPAELSAWVLWLRAGVIIGLFTLLMAGRTFAQLPIPPLPIICIAVAASSYNGLLALVVWRTRERPAPAGDRIRARVLYVGGLLDAASIALVVLFTGGLVSPWLYFFLATSVVSSAILPPLPGRILTAVNAAAALIVIVISSGTGSAYPLTLNFWSQPGYGAIVGLSLIALMALTAYAVSVPVENARAAARFQEGMASIALILQHTAGVDQALAALCSHAHHWFGVDRATVALLEGEALVVRAAEGADAAGLVGRRTAVSDRQSLDVEVLRRRAGFYVNRLQRSAYRGYPAVEELGDAAVLLVPLVGALGTLGVLSLAYRRRPGRFTPTSLQRANILAAQAGVAVENARLLERVREEADGVTSLLSALERLTQSHDLPTLLTDLNRIGAEMVRCDRSTTFLWEARRRIFYFGSTFGNPPPLVEAMRQFEFAPGIFPQVDRVLAGETFVVSAQQAAEYLPPDLRQALRIGASAVIPLSTERGVQGVMAVSYLDPLRDFSAEQLWMLRGIARYAALAIERARLIAQEHEAATTAEALVALGRELSATLDRRTVLARIPEMAAAAAGCDFAVLSLWDSESCQARILGACGFSPEATQELLALPLDTAESPFTDAVMQAGYLEIESPQSLPGLPSGLMEHFQVSSLLCCVFGPVEQRVGSLTVGYRGRTVPFSAAQKRLIDGIAQQAAVVLENTRLVEDLRQASQLKSDFLSTISHELRTPLNAIIGYSELLYEQAMGPLQPEQLEAMDVIVKKSVQLLELINTTLDLTRMEAGQVDVSLSEFSVADLLTDIEGELADEVPPPVQFACVIAPDLPLLISDRLKLKTVIRNLVHNALKFTRRGRVEVRAELAARPAHVQLVVRDTGIGIAAENVTAIFEMFRQLEPATTRRFGGVGLGLYIVQRLLELLHGEIHVQSEPGAGSVFTVTVPLRLE